MDRKVRAPGKHIPFAYVISFRVVSCSCRRNWLFSWYRLLFASYQLMVMRSICLWYHSVACLFTDPQIVRSEGKLALFLGLFLSFENRFGIFTISNWDQVCKHFTHINYQHCYFVHLQSRNCQNLDRRGRDYPKVKHRSSLDQCHRSPWAKSPVMLLAKGRRIGQLFRGNGAWLAAWGNATSAV